MAKRKKTAPVIPINLDFINKLDFTKKEQGFCAVLVGIIIALILSTLVSMYHLGASWIWLILLFGVVIGVLNIFHEEGVLLLVIILALTFMLNLLAGLAIFPLSIINLFNALIYLLAPAGVIVGLKVLYALATK